MACRCSLLAGSAIGDDAALRGFKPESALKQREWEAKLFAIPEAARLRESMRLLSARPHHVGSAYGKQNAEWLLARFKEYGWDAKIETFNVLFPTPKERLLEMVEPKKFVASLDEPALAIDPTSSQKTEQLPTYNSYSVDGDVTGPLVYVNYGLPEDYDRLERLGISVKGAIVIARYGNSWRAGSSPRWRPSTAPSAASSTRIRGMTATSSTTSFRRGRCGPRPGCSGEVSWTSRRRTPAIL